MGQEVKGRALSFGQKSFWFLSQINQLSTSYKLNFIWKLPSDVDRELLTRSLEVIYQEHPQLRSRFVEEGGEPKQVFDEDFQLDFELIHCSDSDEKIIESVYFRLKNELRLDNSMSKWIWFERVNEPPILVWMVHHIVMDMWSLVRFMELLQPTYEALSREQKPTFWEQPYSHDYYVEKQLQYLEGQQGQEDRAYWLSALNGADFNVDFPTERPRSGTEGCNTQVIDLPLPDDLTQQISDFCYQRKTPLPVFFLSVYNLLLHKYSQQRDLCVGMPTLGRDDYNKDIIGYFVGPAIVRSCINDEDSVQDYINSVKDQLGQITKHAKFPLSELTTTLPAARTATSPSLFQFSFTFESVNSFASDNKEFYQLNEDNVRCWDMASLGIWQQIGLKIQDTDQDLFLRINKVGKKLLLIIEYNGDLFSANSIRSIFENYLGLLQKAINQHELRVDDLSLLCEEQQDNLTKLYRQKQIDTPVRDEFLDLLIQSFEHSSTDIAVATSYDSMTYRDLDEHSDLVAHYLEQRFGNQPERVGVLLEKSPTAIAVIVGIFKAGHCYVPLDPKYPELRLQYIVEDADVALIISDQRELQESFSHLTDSVSLRTVLSLSTDGAVPVKKVERKLSDSANWGTRIAYIIYTSGSTGNPKGVPITYYNLNHLCATQNYYFKRRRQDKVLLSSSLNFDASIFLIVYSLAAGGTLCIPQEQESMGDELKIFIQNHSINWALLTPSVLVGYDPDELSGISTLIVGGEACSKRLVEKWSPGRRFINAYGPTEASVWSTMAELTANDIPHIGSPVPNTTIFVLDNNQHLVPIGGKGELYIGGSGLTEGYLNREALNQERFIENPVDGFDGKVYRTGDVVKLLPNGNLEYIGRSDNQVKIRGFRIELGEVDANLQQLQGVNEVVSLAVVNNRSEPELVAFVCGEEQLSEQALKKQLAEKLPAHQVPSRVCLLDAFPLTPNQKIDLRALQEVYDQTQRHIAHRNLESPRTKLETVIHDVWKNVLGVHSIGIDENFFDLGGHSLLLPRVHAALRDEYGFALPLIELFKHPTIRALSLYLEQDDEGFYIEDDKHIDRQRLRRRLMQELFGTKIAIVGLAGRFPGANSVQQLWSNISEGKISIKEFSREELLASGVTEEELEEGNYVPRQGEIEDVQCFDAEFFGFTPREAQLTDPQHRIFMEVVWEALEDAGCVPQQGKHAIGLYAGQGLNRYLIDHLIGNPQLIDQIGEYAAIIANEKDFLTTKTAYKLNLSGPAISIQTACSTSLVAVHSACEGLLNQECDVAIAGGIALHQLELKGYKYQEGMILSQNGECRPFDEGAQGTVPGQGAGAVVLKRLDDALESNDQIYAVIQGTAVNNDGSQKIGFTAPGVEGQTKVIKTALAKAGIDPKSISYVEAHGTGTPIGDPIEFEGLQAALGESRQESVEELPIGTGTNCLIGSIKANLGHLDAAAGVTGLIKTALMLKHKKIPPLANYVRSNERIDLDNSRFRINHRLQDWEAEISHRRAAVSSFGIGGTNAHGILQEGPREHHFERSRPVELLCVSAKTPEALDNMCDRLAEYFKRNPDTNLGDAAYTLNVGRHNFNLRRFFVCHSQQEATMDLLERDPRRNYSHTYQPANRKIVFMFPGQGSQYVNMAKQLFQVEIYFRDIVKECINYLQERFTYLYDDLTFAETFGGTEKVNETYLTQPVLFIVEYALARTLIHWGVEPDVMIGHSIGEYVAACLAGVFTKEQALEIVAIRGKLIQDLPAGDMLSVNLGEEDVKKYLSENCSLAAVNGNKRTVLAGDPESMLSVHDQLNNDGVENHLLHTSHAFHSYMMNSIMMRFRQVIAKRNPQAPTKPFISNVTGRLISKAEATSPDYWVRHLRGTVRFHDGFEHLMSQRGENEQFVCLEVGPGKVLSTLTRHHPRLDRRDLILSTTRRPNQESSDCEVLLKSIGQLWFEGIEINWQNFYANRQRFKISLPAYPFERKEYWIPRAPRITGSVKRDLNPEALSILLPLEGEDKDHGENSVVTSLESSGEDVVGEFASACLPSNEIETTIAQVWSDTLGLSNISRFDDFFDLGGDSLLAVPAMDRIRRQLDIALSTPVLIQYSRLVDLADYIAENRQHPSLNGGESESHAARCLLQLQSGDAQKPTFYMVHPIGGDVLHYRDFAHAIGSKYSVFGFQAPGLNGNCEPLNCVSEMAGRYLEELQLYQPQGPYILGGSSFGGFVAYEMAQRLTQAGYEVPLLIMIDTPSPDLLPALMSDSAAILEYLLADTLTLNWDELRACDEEEQVIYVLEEAQKQEKNHLIPPHLGVPMFKTWIAHQKAMFDYQIQDYSGRLLYFRHTERTPSFPAKPHATWASHVLGSMEIYRVPGNHISMNYAPNVGVIAHHIKSVISRLSLGV